MQRLRRELPPRITGCRTASETLSMPCSRQEARGLHAQLLSMQGKYSGLSAVGTIRCEEGALSLNVRLRS